MDDREKGLRGAYQFIGVKYKLILYNYLLLKQFTPLKIYTFGECANLDLHRCKMTKQEHEHNCK